MTLLGRVHVPIDPSTSDPSNAGSAAQAKLTRKVNDMPLRDAVLLGPFNLAPTTQQIAAHGLGRPAKGFLVATATADASGGGVGQSWATVTNLTHNLPSAISATHVAAYNGGGTPAVFYLLVF